MQVQSIRPPAVAGMFYPGTAAELANEVTVMLTGTVPPAPTFAGAPKALIAPHAGYIYSGPVAASAYALIAPQDRKSVV